MHRNVTIIVQMRPYFNAEARILLILPRNMLEEIGGGAPVLLERSYRRFQKGPLSRMMRDVDMFQVSRPKIWMS